MLKKIVIISMLMFCHLLYSMQRNHQQQSLRSYNVPKSEWRDKNTNVYQSVTTAGFWTLLGFNLVYFGVQFVKFQSTSEA